jgi:triosephosphate isomerase (TIM)
VVIAYEPIWTIGTGRMAPLEHVQEVGALVRGVVAERSNEQATRTRVLYGESVSADTAATQLALDDVDGLLVGESSLDADRFLSILNAVRS